MLQTAVLAPHGHAVLTAHHVAMCEKAKTELDKSIATGAEADRTERNIHPSADSEGEATAPSTKGSPAAKSCRADTRTFLGARTNHHELRTA
jgi:hypothetical protein